MAALKITTTTSSSSENVFTVHFASFSPLGALSRRVLPSVPKLTVHMTGRDDEGTIIIIVGGGGRWLCGGKRSAQLDVPIDRREEK